MNEMTKPQLQAADNFWNEYGADEWSDAIVAAMKLGGVEHNMLITIGDRTIRGESESEVERTKADGKTSSVHFTRFRFTDDDVVDGDGDSAVVDCRRQRV